MGLEDPYVQVPNVTAVATPGVVQNNSAVGAVGAAVGQQGNKKDNSQLTVSSPAAPSVLSGNSQKRNPVDAGHLNKLRNKG